MNMLFLSTRSPYPLVSGHSLRTYHILKGASEAFGMNLMTFIQHDSEADAKNIAHLKSFCKSICQYKVSSDTSKVKLFFTILRNLFSPLPFVAQKYDSSEMRTQIRKLLKAGKIDIVHVDMLPLSCYLNEFPELPKILVNHNVESLRLYRWYKNEKNIFKKLFLYLQYRKLKNYEICSMGLYDACVVVSDMDKTILEEMGVKNDIYVVPNGTDTSFFTPGEEKSTPNSVVWMGHMDVQTNRDAVLYFLQSIYPLIVDKFPDVQMSFVGGAPPTEIIAAAKTDSRIHVTGFVDDIRSYVQSAAVFVVPIRIGSGTRLKILDAMAMKKAIVSTSIGCEGIDVTDGENILIADTPYDFAEKVVTLLRDEELRTRLEKNAHKLSFEYDWKHQCRLQHEVYRDVLGN